MRNKILTLLLHPASYVCIVLVCILVGGVMGYYSLAYGQRGLLTTTGLLYGFSFGLGLSLIWGLISKLYDD